MLLLASKRGGRARGAVWLEGETTPHRGRQEFMGLFLPGVRPRKKTTLNSHFEREKEEGR